MGGEKQHRSHRNNRRRVRGAQHLTGWAVGKGTLFASLHHNITYSMFITIKINLNQLLQFVNSKPYDKNKTEMLLKSIKKLEKLQTHNKKKLGQPQPLKKLQIK